MLTRGLTVSFLLLAACGGQKSENGPDAGDAGVVNNTAPLLVDIGPPEADAYNTAYTTVTICRPGTNVCQTIDHIQVDTGSSGLRIISTVLDPSLMLPQEMQGSSPVFECYQYVDSFNWGPVATADVQFAGETAAALPIHIAGGTTTAAPSDCSSVGSEGDTVASLGANGIVGVDQETADCGSDCASTPPASPDYYTCTGATCTPAVVAIEDQVTNPVSRFAQDNNGVVLQLPAIDPSGAVTVTGSLIFGIGTQSNNGLGEAQILTIDDVNGYFTTVFNGQMLTSSYIDSGTDSYDFPDSTITQCTDDLEGFYCPASTLSLTATNVGMNQVSVMTTFSIANTNTLFSSATDTAFNDLGTTALMPGYFGWGLSFFFGRSVFTAITNANTPGGPGPYFAY
jgi:hypothetical protein